MGSSYPSLSSRNGVASVAWLGVSGRRYAEELGGATLAVLGKGDEA